MALLLPFKVFLGQQFRCITSRALQNGNFHLVCQLGIGWLIVGWQQSWSQATYCFEEVGLPQAMQAAQKVIRRGPQYVQGPCCGVLAWHLNMVAVSKTETTWTSWTQHSHKCLESLEDALFVSFCHVVIVSSSRSWLHTVHLAAVGSILPERFWVTAHVWT